MFRKQSQSHVGSRHQETRSNNPQTTHPNLTQSPLWTRALSQQSIAGPQFKLTVNEPGDRYEREADRVAAQVVHMPEPGIQRACSCGGSCPNCQAATQQMEDQMLARAALNTGTHQSTSTGDSHAVDYGVARQVQAIQQDGGQPLPESTQRYFEPRFGADFSDVRVHINAQAAESAQALNAHAYTIGQDIVFGPGEYRPESAAGQHLIAHELVHTLQQGPQTIRRDGPACTTTFRPARSFAELISLVTEAETRLSAAGYTSVEDRIHVLRGIYYGTTWSADYLKERSPVRNLGFQTYTASLTPDDPRPHLPCNLFEALRGSQDVTDGGRHVDFGHLIIGLDARRSRIARSVPIPSQGGTGLEISTWLGDLGGGAGSLAVDRVSTASKRAMTKFTGSDYGGSINLEGDVAGFVVARDTSASGISPVLFNPGDTIATALSNYLSSTASGSEWNRRCTTFLEMNGATFDSSSNLTNRSSLITMFAGKIEAFACWYMVNRLRQTGRLSLSRLRSASLHISGASQEIAEIFVDTLDNCHHSPGRRLEARGTGPAPTPAGSSAPFACSAAIRALELAEEADRLRREAEELVEEYWPF